MTVAARIQRQRCSGSHCFSYSAVAPAGNYKQEQHDASPHSADVRDAVLVIIESSCPSADRDRTLAPRPRVRCSIVSLVAGAGVAALRAHCRCCPFYGSQGCPSLACAAGFVQGGSCAHGRVISWPLVPRLPPQLAFAVTRSSCLRTLNRSKFCHGSHAPGGRLRGPRDGAGAVLQFKFEKNRPSFVRT